MLARMVFGVCVLAASAVLVWQVFFPASGNREQLAADREDSLAEPYRERDWQRDEPGQLHISLYTFRDNNRSGRYDVGDLPMASVVVDLTGPDGELTRGASNINGYANFTMALDNPDFPIDQPGRYRFEVVAPPGWRISSANPVQDIEFVRLPGSVAGLVARPAPQWVGLMPELAITGRLVPAGEGPLPGDLQVALTDADGRVASIGLTDAGDFQAAVEPGRWRLRVASPLLGWRLERMIEVAAVPVELMDITVGAPLPAPQPVTVVENFDWLQRSVIDKIPNGHKGLEWDYLLAIDNQEYGGPGYVNGLISGHAVAYNSSGQPVTIAAAPGEVFDFIGGYFSVAWPAAQGETLDVVAWRGEQEVARHALTLSYLGAVWLDADLRAIDKLTLSARHYWQFVVDDLAFRLASSG